MREPANIDAIIDLMDRTPEEMDAQNVPAPVRDRILRIRALYSWWLVNPRKTDQELVFKDMQDYRVQRMMQLLPTVNIISWIRKILWIMATTRFSLRCSFLLQILVTWVSSAFLT